MKIIKLKDLSFDYGDGWVFHKLNIEIDEGDFVAVIGANGAGKSTLMKMLDMRCLAIVRLTQKLM